MPRTCNLSLRCASPAHAARRAAPSPPSRSPSGCPGGHTGGAPCRAGAQPHPTCLHTAPAVPDWDGPSPWYATAACYSPSLTRALLAARPTGFAHNRRQWLFVMLAEGHEKHAELATAINLLLCWGYRCCGCHCLHLRMNVNNPGNNFLLTTEDEKGCGPAGTVVGQPPGSPVVAPTCFGNEGRDGARGRRRPATLLRAAARPTSPRTAPFIMTVVMLMLISARAMPPEGHDKEAARGSSAVTTITAAHRRGFCRRLAACAPLWLLPCEQY